MSRRLSACLMLVALLLPVGATSAQAENRRTGASDDPTEASLLMSNESFLNGEARFVVIGRNDVFADNLAGAPLAGQGGPLLLVPPTGGLPDSVRNEIARVHPETNVPACDDSDDPARLHDIYILGGASAVDLQAETQLVEDGYCVKRLAGPSRVETSVEVARQMLRLTGAVTPRRALLIARTDNAADSAPGGVLGAQYGDAILVTATESLHPAVQGYLTDTSEGEWQVIRLLGGTAALSGQVEQQIADAIANQATPGFVQRYAGSTRDDTARIIAGQYSDDRRVNNVIVNGFSESFWTYALPGAVIAARENAPMLYVQRDFVPETTDQYLRTRDPAGSLITIGPESQVDAETQADAEAALAAGQDSSSPRHAPRSRS